MKKRGVKVEAAPGFEPGNNGFAAGTIRMM